MQQFGEFFGLGFFHIVDWAGLDHILFIAVLTAVYSPWQWRRVLLLATAFTIGHSFTLALAVLDLLSFDRRWIELMIPVTIMLTAVLNFYEKPSGEASPTSKNMTLDEPRSAATTPANKPSWSRYFVAIGFGFIHGFAFSGLLMRLFQGVAEEVIFPLFAFNVGIEVGQVLVIVLFMIISALLVEVAQWSWHFWGRFLSGLSFVIAMGIFLFKSLAFL